MKSSCNEIRLSEKMKVYLKTVEIFGGGGGSGLVSLWANGVKGNLLAG